MERHPGIVVCALLAALLLVTAWPAHGCGCNDDPEGPGCSQVSRKWRPLQLLVESPVCAINYTLLEQPHPRCINVQAGTYLYVHFSMSDMLCADWVHLQGCATGEVVIPQGQRCGGDHSCSAFESCCGVWSCTSCLLGLHMLGLLLYQPSRVEKADVSSAAACQLVNLITALQPDSHR